MITVGIIGCGFVGGALKAWLEANNKDVKIVVSDPPKGMNDDISGADVYFLQIHVPTEDDGTQDLTLMKQLIKELPDKPVFVRTTILPGTSERLSKETGHRVYYMPEFLTERTYIEDFKHQPMVFTGEVTARFRPERSRLKDWAGFFPFFPDGRILSDTATCRPPEADKAAPSKTTPLPQNKPFAPYHNAIAGKASKKRFINTDSLRHKALKFSDGAY